MSWSIYVKGKRDRVRAQVDKEAESFIKREVDADQVTAARNLIQAELDGHDADAIVSVEASGSVSTYIADAVSNKRTTNRSVKITVERLHGFLVE